MNGSYGVFLLLVKKLYSCCVFKYLIGLVSDHLVKLFSGIFLIVIVSSLMALFNSVRGWEKELKVKLEYDVIQGKVHKLQ